MKLVIMTKPTFFVEEDKILAALFDEGLESLHLYKPGSSPLYVERLLSLLPDEYYSKITVHEHYYLKNEYGLSGIHIDDVYARPPEGYRGRVGRTCRDLSLLKEARRNASYVFLGNLFDSIEIEGKKADFNMSELEEASRRGLINRHVYAMGGMTADNVRMARNLGFGGVVVCGDLWRRFDIHTQTDFKDIMAHFERLRRAVD